MVRASIASSLVGYPLPSPTSKSTKNDLVSLASLATRDALLKELKATKI